MKKMLTKINETGTLLIEALAMLGLISMVTPVLYKKAAERTTELQDINASSQLRAIATAMDAYLKDNFAKITRGDGDVSGGDFSAFQGNDTSASAEIDISALKDYLPYGMMDGTEMRATRLFANEQGADGLNSNYKIVVRLNRDIDNNTGQPIAQTLTGFIVAEPKAGLVNSTRAARIASMVGSNGGVVEDDAVNGTQGIWTVAGGDLMDNMANNTLVISSLEPITSQGLSNENVLYRVPMPENDYALNAMTTDLFMGTDAAHSRNIRMVNQIVMTPDASRMVGSGNQTDKANVNDAGADNSLANALYIANGGGANMEGELRAMMRQFVVSEDGADAPQLDMYMGEANRDAENATFHVGEANLTYGNPGGTMIFDVTDTNLRYTRRSDDRESLNVAENTLEAMDKTLLVDKSGDNGFVTIGSGVTAARQHTGNGSPYTWANGVATEGTFESQNYRLTVDGSVFAKDTVYAGKVKGFDTDAAKLRAGVSRSDFDSTNNDDNYFMMTEKDDEGSVFSLSDNGHAINNSLIYANTRGENPGVTVDTSSYEGGGIDLISGKTGLLPLNSDGVTNNLPQEGKIRLGASSGVFLSTYNDTGTSLNTDTPVSIQGDILQVYKDEKSGVINPNGSIDYKPYNHVVDVRTDNFWATTRSGNNGGGRYFIEGMQFDVGRYDSNTTIYVPQNNEIGRNELKARSILNIQPNIYGKPTGNDYGNVTTRFSGGIGVYDYDAPLNTNRRNPNSTAAPAALFIDKGKFEIRSTQPITKNTNGSVSTVLDKGVLVLAVDNNMDSHYGNNTNRYGSVYIRRGGINIDTARTRLTNQDIAGDYPGNGGTPNPSSAENLKGYIAADRFISHYHDAGKDQRAIAIDMKMADADGLKPDYEPYNKYEVNPAYTSVMHDIKLTTRGSARLSDILPDFINKGIYVVDTSYLEDKVGDWTVSFGVDHCKGNNCNASAANDKVSAYVGFVPTPKCPAGYAKVITLTPAGWAMAQAGKLTKEGNQDGGRPDVNLPDAEEVWTQNQATTSDAAPIYLDYQKSTWLRSEVRPVYGGIMNASGNAKNFNGWGLIMGFIYPHSKYSTLASGLDIQSANAYYHGGSDENLGGGTGGDTVYWNLFPVYNNEIEGYATVYCYFDRTKTTATYDEEYVDKYDQLGKFNETNSSASQINSYDKDSNYIDRLNDQRLKYRDPW